MPVVSDAQRRTIVFCDGATKGNPGPGGWGAIVVTPDGRVTELAHAADDIVFAEIENWQAVFGGKHIAVPV